MILSSRQPAIRVQELIASGSNRREIANALANHNPHLRGDQDDRSTKNKPRDKGVEIRFTALSTLSRIDPTSFRGIHSSRQRTYGATMSSNAFLRDGARGGVA
jgi:hypothetical protein